MTMEIVRIPEWNQYDWLRHGFSTRAGGVSVVYGPGELNLGFTPGDDRAVVLRNREAFLDELASLPVESLATVRQVHSATVLRVACAGVAGEGDGLVTSTPGVMLGVLTADCVPVLVADTRLRVVGAFHAGWRGTATGIVDAGVQEMRSGFGCRAEDLVAAVGPSIGACCYRVGPELRDSFAADLFSENDRLDLWEANRRQLVSAGVGKVSVVGECTACCRVEGGAKYFSHRADLGVTGRSMGVIGVL